MITQLWPITLLVTQIVLGYDHKIDLERCNKDTACFIRQTCTVADGNTQDAQYSTKRKVMIEYKKDPLNDNYCDVILQMKQLTKRKIHVMMQIKLSGTSKIKVEDGLILNQDIDQFVCKPPDKTTGSPKFKFSLAGKPIYESQHLFCSFFAEFKSDSDDFSTNFQHNRKTVKLKFTIDNVKEELDSELTKDNFWRSSFCDRDLVSSPKMDHPTDKSILLTEVDTYFDNLECPGGFFVFKQTGDAIVSSKVVCHRKKEEWQYDAGGIMTPIKNEADQAENFKVYCSEKVCRKCDAPPSHLSSCANCKAFDPPSPFLPSDLNQCPTLKCTDDKWTKDGRAIIEGTAECRSTKADPTKFAWTVNGQELTGEAACLNKLKCPTVECEPKNKCKLDSESNSMTCAKDYKLKLHNSTTGVFAADNKIECSTTTGHFFDSKTPNLVFENVSCLADSGTDRHSKAGFFTENQLPIFIVVGAAILIGLIGLAGCIYWMKQKKKNKKGKTEVDTKQSPEKKTSEKKDKSSNTSNSATVSAMSAPPGGVDGSEGKTKSKKSKRDSKTRSNKSKKEDKFKLEDFETWDNEQFAKKILPNFNAANVDSKAKWLRNHMCRFYAYSNTKKIPECGTFNQYWLLVKRCMDDKCEDAVVWRLLWRTAFTMAYSVIEKTAHSDEFRLLVIKPFETYMVEYLKKCDLYKRKDEPRAETEMRVICIEILLHTRHPDVTEELRKMTFNEKLEVPLRMLTAACLTRERDDFKQVSVQDQYKRVCNTSVLDPHINEGWGTYLQHCMYGLGAFLITDKEVYQTLFFEAMYQVEKQKDEKTERRFAPSDWLFAFKGALLHENSAKIALEAFKKHNDNCLLHIEVLLKKNNEDPTDLQKTRDLYKLDMKEYTMMLADLLVGEEEYTEFEPHLRFVIIYAGESAKGGAEPLEESRIRERAINMGNMVRDRNFFKESCDSLKAIGAKIV